MCYSALLEIRLSDRSAIEKSCPEEFSLELASMKGPNPKRIILSAVHGNCACDLVRMPQADESKQRRSYKKKGWSESKINRALSSKKAKPSHSRHFQEWLAALQTSRLPIHLLIHWNSDPYPTDEVMTWCPHNFEAIPKGHWLRLISSAESVF